MVNGWDKAVDQVAIGWLILMGCLYITGALLYAVRIPERFFPGKLDIWVRSCIQEGRKNFVSKFFASSPFANEGHAII